MSDAMIVKPPSPEAIAAFRRHLPLSQKASLAAEIVGTYVRSRRLLRCDELAEAVGAMRAAGPPARTPDGDQLLVGIRLGRIVGKTLGVLPADSRCLVRSLVLTSLLVRRGIQSSLVIGVRTEPSFEAHAWVECAGTPLLPPGDEQYGRLVEL
jgi:transglutaminase superfamily protein